MKKTDTSLPVRKNQEIEVYIDDLGLKGEGIGHFEGFAIMVLGALPGEKVLCHIIKVTSRYAVGKLLRILEKSPARQEPVCPVFGKCGGCSLQHLSYEAQLSWKEERVKAALQRIGKLDPASLQQIRFSPIIGMKAEQALGYRNKAQFPFGRRDQKVIAGFYQAHSHEIVAIDSCPLQDERINTLYHKTLAFLSSHPIEPYDMTTGEGVLRHLYYRAAQEGLSMTLVVAKDQAIPKQELIEFAKENGVLSLSLNLQPAPTNVILGSHTITLFGSTHLEDQLMVDDETLSFQISPESFYQVNASQTGKLYQASLNLANLSPNDLVLDLYCGIGTITLFAAKLCRHIFGVEVVPQAIENAKSNASLNQIENASFLCGSAEEVLPSLIQELGRPLDVVLVDPPRSGLDKTVVETLLQAAPSRIVYISCDPSTLARDIDLFCHADGSCYLVEAVQPVDMFPQTTHVETVVLLRRKNIDDHLELTWTDEEFGNKGRKATYEELKSFILETYGLRVSQLNIAQIKRKCGIIERENYNLPKSEDSRQPNCTPEKEEAIMDAFMHFKMI